jgi:hypothetical protein
MATPACRILRQCDHELVLSFDSEPGYYSVRLATRPGRFDVSTLDVRMTEHPSGRRVVSRGWDLNHLRNVMAVPVLTAYQDGRELGDVWFDVPNHTMTRQRWIDTELGLRVDVPGRTELRLVVLPRDRRRFRFAMLQTPVVERDFRREAPVQPRSKLWRGSEPWLFLQGRPLRQVQAGYRRNRQVVEAMPAMFKRMRAGQAIPYIAPEQFIAAASLITGAPAWRKLAIERLRDLATRPTWSGRDNPRLMGGDNDMPIGHLLLSLAMLAHYHWDQLDDTLRQQTLAMAQRYADKLYQFSVLQKRYATGLGSILTHECCPLLGLAVAAMVFWKQLPDSRRWLAWSHDRMKHALATAPRDGRATWLNYGSNFVVTYVAALADFAGLDCFDVPYFDKLPEATARGFDAPTSIVDLSQIDVYHRWNQAILSAYRGDKTAQWVAHESWRRLRRRDGRKQIVIWPDLFWPAPPVKAPALDLNASHLFSDVGMAVLRTDEQVPRLACAFQSGFAIGRAAFGREPQVRYSMERHTPHADGAVTVVVNGSGVIWENPGIYRKGLASQSAVTVDGDGHYMEGRWLGVRPAAGELSRMVSFRRGARRVEAVGDNTGAYRRELGVLRSRRRVCLDLDSPTPTLTVSDQVECRGPRELAVRYQCSGSIRRVGPGEYLFIGGDMAALTRNDALAGLPRGLLILRVQDHDQFRIQVRQSQMVLPYIYGQNTGSSTYKGIGKASLPKPVYLEIACPRRSKRASFAVTLEPVGEDDIR